MIPCLNAGSIGGPPPLAEFIEIAAGSGFGGIEFSIQEAAALAREISQPAVIDLFRKAGVSPAMFGIPVEWRRDQSSYQSDLKNLPRLCRMAQEMGCTRSGTWLPPAIDGDDVYFRSQTQRRFHEMADMLGDFGISFALEWVGPKTMRDTVTARGGHEFVWNLPGTLDLIADIDAKHKNVGLLVDSFHWYTTGATEEDLTALTDNTIVHVHINDAPDLPRDEQQDRERLLPGAGIIDLQAFIRGLRSANYAGFVAVETFDKVPMDDREIVARRVRESLRQLL